MFALGLPGKGDQGPKLTKMRDIGKQCGKCKTRPKMGEKCGIPTFFREVGNSGLKLKIEIERYFMMVNGECLV